MPLSQTYADAYLAPLVTVEREARAAADVADLGTLPAAWVNRLTVLRAYVLTCLESQRTPDDVFAAKLGAYRKEFDAALTQGRQAQAALDATAGTASGGGSIFSVNLVRA
jgi:hypothetical protein